MNGNTKYVPMPPNFDTVNMLFNENITSKEEMIAWLDERRPNKGKGEIKFDFTHRFYIRWLHIQGCTHEL